MTSPSRLSLVELLDQARGGDSQARDRLFANCRNYLAVVARAEAESWLRAKVDPSDIVQQTLLEAHRGLANFRGQTEAEWLAWLRRILNHNAADFVRHYAATEKRAVGHEVRLNAGGADSSAGRAPEPAAADGTPSQLLMSRELELELADAIARLPDDYQQVVVLRNLAGSSSTKWPRGWAARAPPCRCFGCGRSGS